MSISATYSGPVNGLWTLQLDGDVNVDSFGFIVAVSRATIGVGTLPPGCTIAFWDYPTSPGGTPKISWSSQSRISVQDGCPFNGRSFTLAGTTNGVADGVYTPPVASNGAVSGSLNTPLVITLPTNAGGLCGPFTVTIITNPVHGTLSNIGPTPTYTPNVGFVGVDSFTWRATGCGVNSATVTETITIVPPTIIIGGEWQLQRFDLKAESEERS